MVDSFPEINESENLSKACIKGKQHRQSFFIGKLWRARRPLEIIHTDIAGPFDIPSLGVYLLNHCPVKSVRNKTPNKAWSGRKPSVGHFRIFGCISYAHVPDQKRKKLDDKGDKCIFTGYDKRSKAYRLHNPLTKNLIISRDVEFDESDYWRWSEEERKVVGLFFNEDDNDGDDSNIKDDGDDDLTPPQSLTQQTPASILSTGESHSSGGAPRKMRSPDNIYEATSPVQTSFDYSLFYLIDECDPFTFEEASQESKWNKDMDEEIGAIKKNDT
ncbi:uncharacterized protein LOC141709860 [Apium graveolens]|uniref:uncharacterized protein LOC141709860 n=1 Tax=Apium graveolens TaxID=4045 RepID=UPI003D7AFAB6